MARQRIVSDRLQTNVELKRRQHDKACSIDADLDSAYSLVDWRRRQGAEQSLVSFTKTYLIGLGLDEPPSQKGEEVLMQMDKALRQHSNSTSSTIHL